MSAQPPGTTLALATVMRGSLILASIALVAGCLGTTGDDSTLTVSNQSSFVLVEVHVSPTDDPRWGPNMLPEVLFPGDELVVTGIDCGRYDVRVVDETGVSCDLVGLDLCFDDGIWVIDDFMLDTCAFNPATGS